MLSLFSVKSAGQVVDEYTLKAVWIGKFTHFIDWPPEMHDTLNTFTIATVYSNPFNTKLYDIYKGSTILGRPVNIVHLNELNDSSFAHILYIPPLKRGVVKEIVEFSKEKGVLLIGDTQGYAETGVHVNFFLSEDRLRFEINETAIRESDFFVSYRLLNIAEIVNPIAKE